MWLLNEYVHDGHSHSLSLAMVIPAGSLCRLPEGLTIEGPPWTWPDGQISDDVEELELSSTKRLG